MKVLVKAVAGSHLFGTNTEKSDHDYKGVFLPTADDILLGKFDQTRNQKTNNTNNKNTKDDVDIEFYSLDKFLKMLYQGQTVAWELLFTPDEMILEKHPLWDEIREATPLLINKNVDAFIGYCSQQAHKYGIRGSRMNTVETVIKYLKEVPDYHPLSQICLDGILTLEHVEMIEDKNGKALLTVCGKKFGLDTKLQYIIQPLEKYFQEYGDRSRLAKENKNIDWKALSHAVRVCMQASSLLLNGKIELPMSEYNVRTLKYIKNGEYSFKAVCELIEQYQTQLLKDQKISTLPEAPNLEAFQDIQKRIYSMVVKGEI